MEEFAIINAIAMTLGAAAVAVTAVPAVFRAVRSWKVNPDAHQLVVQVDHHTYVLDARSIDREDPAKIKRVIDAVREANRITA